MKIGFVTTINTNIGDDFIRQGIINILQSEYKEKELQFVSVNKHFPYSAYPAWNPLHYIGSIRKLKGGKRLERILKNNLPKLGGSKFENCDLIIQSGAPVLWPNCHRCEWNIPIWQEIIGRLHRKIPVFNIAAGSCYPWENQPEMFHNGDEENYAKMIGEFCHLTTTRDILSNRLFDEVQVKNILLPCSAFFVDPSFKNDQHKEYILINYMHGGGHFDWGQNINGNEWEHTMKETIRHLKLNHEIRFICHSEKEVQAASQLDSTLRIHFPKSVSQYIEVIKPAKLGINNRMHASVAMASVGVPSISVCTDTRLLMLQNIGLPISYVKDIDSAKLVSMSDQMLDEAHQEQGRLFGLKQKSFDQYKALFRKHF